jgi:hypothetical protein
LLYRPVLEGKATLFEVKYKYTIDEIIDLNDLIDYEQDLMYLNNKANKI